MKKLFTENNIEITKRVEKRQTLISKNIKAARYLAEKMKSYYYPVYEYVNKGKEKEFVFWGYGIPK
jgi:hypothetical protein